MRIGILSARVEAALLQAVFVACDDAVTIVQEDKALKDPHPRLTGFNWPTAVLSIVEGAVRECVAAYQAELPVSRLPPEVLIHIFGPLGKDDRVSLSLVCRSWNKLLLGTSTLWNRVDFIEDSPPHAVAAYARLSGDIPLEELNVVINRQNLPVICSVLQQNMKRARRLAVRIEALRDLDDDDNSLRLLQEAFASPAPLLQLCILIDEYQSWDSFLDSQNQLHLFSGQAPCLQTVKLDNFLQNLYASAPTFINVTRGLFGSTHSIGAWTIRQVLELCPALTHLGIEFRRWDDDDDMRVGSKIVLPPRLVELLLIVDDGVDPMPLLRHVHHSSLPTVSVTNPAAAHVTPLAELFYYELEPIRTIAFRTARSDDDTILLRVRMYQQDVLLYTPGVLDSSVKERAIFDLELDTNLSRVFPLFRDLRTLYMHELLFHHTLLVADGGNIELPSLVTFIVTLSGPQIMAIAGHESIFFAPNNAGAPLRCPKLQCLRIAQTVHKRSMLLDPNLLSMFLDRWIEFDAPSLPELVLHGTLLLESNLDHVIQLLTKVDRFIVVDGPIQFNCVDSDLLHWGSDLD